MSRTSMLLAFLVTLVITVGLSGCGSSTESTTAPAPDQSQPKGRDHADHGGHSEYAEAFAELSQPDRALAEKQKVCPVSGEPLGSMGRPYKVTVKGQEVFLCCQGCEDKIKENPEEYLAKLSN